MGRVCGMHGGNLNKTDYLEDLGIEWSVILKKNGC
jgi:hypothetical protein